MARVEDTGQLKCVAVRRTRAGCGFCWEAGKQADGESFQYRDQAVDDRISSGPG